MFTLQQVTAQFGRTARLEGKHCSLEISWPALGVVVITIVGIDNGELGQLPFALLEEDIAKGRKIELFVDGRHTRGASLEVSNDWARWLGKHRDRFSRIMMLTGSPFIRITADFVRRFADLHDVMFVTTDASAFDMAVNDATRHAALS